MVVYSSTPHQVRGKMQTGLPLCLMQMSPIRYLGQRGRGFDHFIQQVCLKPLRYLMVWHSRARFNRMSRSYRHVRHHFGNPTRRCPVRFSRGRCPPFWQRSLCCCMPFVCRRCLDHAWVASVGLDIDCGSLRVPNACLPCFVLFRIEFGRASQRRRMVRPFCCLYGSACALGSGACACGARTGARAIRLFPAARLFAECCR